jgi:hypothetical protein
MRIVKLGAAYFAIVFLIGFALGTVRVLWLVPRLGERYSELIETPFMIVASYASARFVLNRVARRVSGRNALAMGLIALVLLLTFELTLVLALRGLSLSDYLTGRDPVSGSAYLVSLLLFALTPTFVKAHRSRR